jgi:hypothetical protein
MQEQTKESLDQRRKYQKDKKAEKRQKVKAKNDGVKPIEEKGKGNAHERMEREVCVRGMNVEPFSLRIYACDELADGFDQESEDQMRLTIEYYSNDHKDQNRYTVGSGTSRH